MSFVLNTLYLILVINTSSDTGLARRSADLYCGACRALVDEIDWEISQVDPEKVVETGAYVLGPDGGPVAITVPYARSEAFLIELLERVCEHMAEYSELVDRDTHRSTYVRVLPRSGAQAHPPDTLVAGDITSNLKRACEKLAEEYEDEFIEYFSRDSDNVKNELCSRRTDLCDHALHTPQHDEL